MIVEGDNALHFAVCYVAEEVIFMLNKYLYCVLWKYV